MNRFGEVFGSDGVCAVKIGNCSSDTCDAIECSKGRPPSLLLCDDVSKAVVILASALPAAAMSLTMANQQMAIHRAMQRTQRSPQSLLLEDASKHGESQVLGRFSC